MSGFRLISPMYFYLLKKKKIKIIFMFKWKLNFVSKLFPVNHYTYNYELEIIQFY